MILAGTAAPGDHAGDDLSRSVSSAQLAAHPHRGAKGVPQRSQLPRMEPLDGASPAELVLRVIDDIDASDDEHRDVLLSDLLCAAWGSVLAQKQ